MEAEDLMEPEDALAAAKKSKCPIMRTLAQEVYDERDTVRKVKEQRDGYKNRIEYLERGIAAAKNALLTL